jgi:hypothetical protein
VLVLVMGAGYVITERRPVDLYVYWFEDGGAARLKFWWTD